MTYWIEVIGNFFLAAGIILFCFAGYSLVTNEHEPAKARQQIVTIKNNGQEIVYYVDGNLVKLGYEDKE